MIYGHDSVVASLERSLPRVSLFIGPPSVGKRTTALHLKKHYGVADADFAYFPHLDVYSSRRVIAMSGMSPQGEFRLVVIRLDNSPRFVQDALLLTLEDTPSTTKFILLSSQHLIPTLESRCQSFDFPLLTNEAVERILSENLADTSGVKRLAASSGGQVSRAFYASKVVKERIHVVQALQAFQGRDSAPIERLASEWSETHTDLLEVWCQEAITGRWRMFDPEDFPNVNKKLAIRILIALRGGVRPRLVVRSGLMDIWKDYTT